MTASAAPTCPHAEAPAYPFAGDARLDTDERYDDLRANEPVTAVTLANGEPAWLVSRYADIKAVLSDPRFSRRLVAGQDVNAATHRLAGQQRSVILPLTDAPEHTTVRRLVAKAFTARRVELMRPRIEQVVDTLLDDLEGAGSPADLVRHFALPLPITIITEMLGVPGPGHATMRSWSEAMMSVDALPAERVVEIKTEFETYMRGVVAQRRAHPEDDLASALIVAGEGGERFTDDEMLAVIMLLMIAGFETTVSSLTNQVLTLLQRPALWQRLLREPQLLPNAVEELLRVVPVGYAGLPLRATETVRVGGVTMQVDDFVLLPKYAANLDPAAFACPATIDFDRGANQHLTFGHGAHYCIGAPLARLEITVALGALLRRLPTLSLAAEPDELEWRTGALIRGPRNLPVAW